MSVKMPDLFNYWTVDEVAECIDGVGQELHRKLWSFITPETSGKNAPLAKVAWKTFSDEEKAKLAAVVAREFPDDDAEYQIYLANADNGKGIDITTGQPMKTYEEWLTS